MLRSNILFHSCCFVVCAVIMSSCFNKPVDKAIAALEDAINSIDRNSAGWQSTVTKLEQDLVAQGQSTLANEVQSVANRGIATAGVELRCEVDFIGQRVNQGLRRLLARLKGESMPPPTPAYCQVDPTEIQLDLVNQRRVTSLNYYGYDMFDNDASDSPMKVFLRNRDGGEEDITSAIALPTHYLMTIRLADDRVHFTDQTDKLIVRAGQTVMSTINVVQPQAQPAPIMVNNLQVIFHTNDENKDHDTGVSVTIQNVAQWQQTQDEEFTDGSDHVKLLSPSSVPLSSLTGHALDVCISPVGNDTWRFNLKLSGTRSDGQPYFYSANSIELSQNNRCMQVPVLP